MMPTRRFRGGDGWAALAGLRLRRLISFLRRHRLYDTAHAVERQTGAFFDAAHLRRLLLRDRCAAASSYARRFVAVGDCSPEAGVLIVRILILRVIADFATGAEASDVEPLFQRLYASLAAYPDCHALRDLLLSMRTDRTKASRIYRRIQRKAVQIIMDLVAKCPELQAKARLPRCTFDPAYIMSLGPGLRGCTSRHRNKLGRIPANVLARSFLQKRPPMVSHKAIHSGGTSQDENPSMLNQEHPFEALDVPSAPVLQVMLAASPGQARTSPTSLLLTQCMKHSRRQDAHYRGSPEQASDSRKGIKKLRMAEKLAEVGSVRY
ncbi:hypothetical protein ACP70R_028520 [Stipagrostis hirtigluma subsp. patula]